MYIDESESSSEPRGSKDERRRGRGREKKSRTHSSHSRPTRSDNMLVPSKYSISILPKDLIQLVLQLKTPQPTQNEEKRCQLLVSLSSPSILSLTHLLILQQLPISHQLRERQTPRSRDVPTGQSRSRLRRFSSEPRMSSRVEDEGGVSDFGEGRGGCLEGVGDDGFVGNGGVVGSGFGSGVVFGLGKGRKGRKKKRGREGERW